MKELTKEEQIMLRAYDLTDEEIIRIKWVLYQTGNLSDRRIADKFPSVSPNAQKTEKEKVVKKK